MSGTPEAAALAAVLDLAAPSDGPASRPTADRLAAHAAGLRGVAAAGVSVTERPTELAAGSTDEPDWHALLAAGTQDGPSAECVRTGRPVAAEHLGRHRQRWLRFVAKADGLGVRAAHALPLRHRDGTHGALLLLYRAPGALSADRLALSHTLITAATVGLRHERELGDAARVAHHLRTALSSRNVIEQAKGSLAPHTGNDVGRAFDALRGHARSRGRPVADVATDVVAGLLAPEEILSRAR